MSAQVAYIGTSVPDWVRELSSSDPLQRRLGAYALGEIGPAATEAVSDLAAALQDPVGFVRVWAAAALARVAPSGGELVTVLIAELGNELAFVRSLAAWHLGRLGPAFPGIEQALLPLRQLAGDKDPSVRVEAALALGMLEGKGAPPPELKSLSHLSLRRHRLARTNAGHMEQRKSTDQPSSRRRPLCRPAAEPTLSTASR